MHVPAPLTRTPNQTSVQRAKRLSTTWGPVHWNVGEGPIQVILDCLQRKGRSLHKCRAAPPFTVDCLVIGLPRVGPHSLALMSDLCLWQSAAIYNMGLLLASQQDMLEDMHGFDESSWQPIAPLSMGSWTRQLAQTKKQHPCTVLQASSLFRSLKAIAGQRLCWLCPCKIASLRRKRSCCLRSLCHGHVSHVHVSASGSVAGKRSEVWMQPATCTKLGKA